MIGADGAMTVLLKDALQPNVVQTLSLIHISAKPAADMPEPKKETAPVEEEKPYIFPPITLLGKDPQTATAATVRNYLKMQESWKLR